MIRTKAGTNIGGAGEHNRRVVMHGLRVNGAMTRAQIARGTGLVPQTVSNIIDDLEREGLVAASDPVKGRRGQPATPYSLAPNGAFSYGLQIDQHRARVVAIDLLGHVVARAEAAFAPGGLQANLDHVRRALAQVATDLSTHAANPAPRLLGLGLAMPAPTGVHRCDGDPWMTGLADDHPLLHWLARHTGLPVRLHHDASAAAIAERLRGSAKGIDNFVLIFVGYGLGAGLYVNGEPYRGHHRLSGELGQVTVPGPTGTCALERLAALIGLLDRLGLQPNQPDLFQRIDLAMRNRDPDIRDWLDEAAAHLIWAIDLIDCLFDPECVIIGGQMPAQLMDLLMEAILTRQPNAPADAVNQGRQIVRGSADPFFVAIGAAADPIARAFDPSFSAMMKSPA